jgi:predicted nucleotidyltransferase
MDQVPYRIKKSVIDYINTLNRNNIPIQQAILFGSYVNGKYNDYSDIDIALVSDSFDGVRFFDRKKILKFALEIDQDIEPMPFKPEQFTTDNPFVKEILETGVSIAEHSSI